MPLKAPGAWVVALAVMLAASQSPDGFAAQQRPPEGGALETIQLRPNVYVIFGAGGNVVVHVGDEGVILVDSGSAPMADQVLAAVRRISASPIRLIINTSADTDHIGGNERIAAEGVNWLDEATLKLETDYGIQTRLFHFRAPPAATAAPTWQGVTTAQWVMAAGRGRAGAPRYGSMKASTTRLRPGYLRKNGVPYSANTVFTEYWDVHTERNGDQWMVVTNVVNDPANLQSPWITSIHFKKEPDGGKWDPTPCSARF